MIHADSQRDVANVREQMGLLTQQQMNGDANLQRRHGNRDYTCPVCMDDATFSVETNCGHVFCGQSFPLLYNSLSSLFVSLLFNFPCCLSFVKIVEMILSMSAHNNNDSGNKASDGSLLWGVYIETNNHRY